MNTVPAANAAGKGIPCPSQNLNEPTRTVRVGDLAVDERFGPVGVCVAVREDYADLAMASVAVPADPYVGCLLVWPACVSDCQIILEGGAA